MRDDEDTDAEREREAEELLNADIQERLFSKTILPLSIAICDEGKILLTPPSTYCVDPQKELEQIIGDSVVFAQTSSMVSYVASENSEPDIPNGAHLGKNDTITCPILKQQNAMTDQSKVTPSNLDAARTRQRMSLISEPAVCDSKKINVKSDFPASTPSSQLGKCVSRELTSSAPFSEYFTEADSDEPDQCSSNIFAVATSLPICATDKLRSISAIEADHLLIVNRFGGALADSAAVVAQPTPQPSPESSTRSLSLVSRHSSHRHPTSSSPPSPCVASSRSPRKPPPTLDPPLPREVVVVGSGSDTPARSRRRVGGRRPRARRAVSHGGGLGWRFKGAVSPEPDCRAAADPDDAAGSCAHTRWSWCVWGFRSAAGSGASEEAGAHADGDGASSEEAEDGAGPAPARRTRARTSGGGARRGGGGEGVQSVVIYVDDSDEEPPARGVGGAATQSARKAKEEGGLMVAAAQVDSGSELEGLDDGTAQVQAQPPPPSPPQGSGRGPPPRRRRKRRRAELATLAGSRASAAAGATTATTPPPPAANRGLAGRGMSAIRGLLSVSAIDDSGGGAGANGDRPWRHAGCTGAGGGVGTG